MFIKILCFGKLDNRLFQQLFDFYQAKIQKKINFEVIELKENYQAETKVNLEVNSNLLQEKINKFSDYEVILLDVDAPMLSSEEFAQAIAKNKDLKTGKLLLVIGPSDGYDQAFKMNYPRISFGKITFPHQLFRLILAEQIYRALKIIGHEQYHK
ncbi:Ribosomal RNA large subunit methyltransferase H [Mesoplasma sp. JKS002658]|uniref:23S rRNA (pseudouridine(1915)-N(3))-methyltransferase RlmH n=1 Tax=Mesoplasma whartonense TaxID=2878854 RepID=UPI002022A231|nr:MULTISPECIES: 23S rRNA (pseudouridine(1915)-N(3))-methyltransferase RlmH [unclassified Mesoplasma]MCL8211098.1 Ribosomal RNA large subunit methyltransferase H [Mesoplasma sp. JKS002664]MCL8211759.1 Ribosomal RNA large subunit methyltransferase H [Mesoplasma sp. JKS002662]MCL8213259.1 Ribosomal RNA large subunit methyltransferase H [Mesoplasma sp. JKS002660]MCL8214136.1 Ribosomal RNA large subunit methyltransferase H [Mesoplasma sp. JKS002658]MCL8214436.1 Ribosomal RNA large subunit methyltr